MSPQKAKKSKATGKARAALRPRRGKADPFGHNDPNGAAGRRSL